MAEYKIGLNGDGDTRSITLKKLSLLIILPTVLISIFLFIGVFFSYRNYKKVLSASENYVEWQQETLKMRESSDYLTKEVRDFVETGEKKYLDNYFHEAETNKNREETLEYIKENFGETSGLYKSINNAFNESVQLMNTEYYAMRLVVEATSEFNIADFPVQVQNVELTSEDIVLIGNSAALMEKARIMLFDKDYMDAKEKIINSTNDCMDKLVNELEKKQNEAEDNMQFALIFEIVMIAIFMTYSVFMLLIVSRQVFKPILHYIPLIKNDSPIPVEGVHELRVLANTYNKMYNEHHKEAKFLEFKTEHDPLTGVQNRRALDKLQLAAEDGKIAFIIVDIDNFKNVNDTYGHSVGDQVLKKVVSYLRLHLRSDDRIFRIGGDEFAIVMFGIDSSARHVIQNKVDSINASLMEEKPEDLPPVSLSVGVAFGNVIDQDLITNADNALYERKNSGKAGVSFHDPDSK